MDDVYPANADDGFLEHILNLFFDGMSCKQIIDYVYECGGTNGRRSQEAGNIAFEFMAKRYLSPRPVVCNTSGGTINPDVLADRITSLLKKRYRVHERAAWLLEQRKIQRSLQKEASNGN